EIDDEGGIIIAGRLSIQGPNNDFYLVRLNSDGTIDWEKSFGGLGPDIARSICKADGGGYLVAGTTKSFGPEPAGGNIWLCKIDVAGDTIWTKAIGTEQEEEAYSVSPTSDGGYIICGRTGNIASN